MRVGTDGDFCSREHRNQFRLRQGMERLMEANTIANLVRRRDRPRSIAPKQVESAAALLRRGFTQLRPLAVQATIRLKPLGVPRKWGGGLRQAHRIQVAQIHAVGGDNLSRAMAVLRPSIGLRLFLGARRVGIKTSDRIAAPSRRISVWPRRGVLLRITGNAGFRIPPVELRQLRMRLSAAKLNPKFKYSSGGLVGHLGATRLVEQKWSALRARLYVAPAGFQFRQPWSGAAPEFKDISRLKEAAGAIPPGPMAAREARVPIGLQATMRYTASGEEERG
jgi:hypothetical protein